MHASERNRCLEYVPKLCYARAEIKEDNSAMPTDTRLTAATVSLGFLSTTAQVVSIRELLVAFTGNELTVATTLALWLLSVAAGCFVFRRALDFSGPRAVGLLFIMAGCAAVVQVVLIRLLTFLRGTWSFNATSLYRSGAGLILAKRWSKSRLTSITLLKINLLWGGTNLK